MRAVLVVERADALVAAREKLAPRLRIGRFRLRHKAELRLRRPLPLCALRAARIPEPEVAVGKQARADLLLRLRDCRREFGATHCGCCDRCDRLLLLARFVEEG